MRLFKAKVSVVAYFVVDDDEEEPDEYELMDALVDEIDNKKQPDLVEEIKDPDYKPEWESDAVCYSYDYASYITIREAMEGVKKKYGKKTDRD